MDLKNSCIFSKGNSTTVVPEPENVQLGTLCLSSNQLDSLTSICDTFLPSIHDANSFVQEAMDDSFIKFLQTSASMTRTPQHIAWMISNRLQHPRIKLCIFALWLLSTRIGTFILCGKASLSSQFPYLQNFSRISPNKREEIVLLWSTSSFKLLRIFFCALKVLVLLVFFTQVIYSCRFFAILAVWGSLIGSFLCFIKGCSSVIEAFQVYFSSRAKVIVYLVEAIDIYLLGTVMLVFGMGLYELFISNLDKGKSMSGERIPYRSNLLGMFTLKERPRWLEISTVSGLKTKIGHVIVMLLLIGLFDKSKRAVISSPFDLLCFAASVLLCSGCLYLLSRLTEEN